MQKVETDILILQETIKSIVVTGAVRTFIGNPTPELQWYDGTKWNTLIEEAPNDGGLYGRKSKGWIALKDDAEPVTASNGITKDGNDIKLGGTLDAPTNIDLNDKMLSFSSEFISVLFDSVNGRIMFIVMGENGISDMSVIDIRENIITISTANLTIYNTNIIGRLKLNDESNNILIGDSSGDYLTLNNNGSTNIIIGIDSFQLAENVSNNISIGNLNFKESIDNVVNNIGIGSLVFSKLINGETNIGIGVEVLQYLETGNRNIGIGEFAGMYYDSDSELTLAEKSIFIGSSTKANGDNQTNQIVIGCDATGNGSNTATIGNADTTDVYLGEDGQANIHAGNLGLVRIIEGDNIGFRLSSELASNHIMGNNAIDLSIVTGIPFPGYNTRGAIGAYSIAIGSDVEAEMYCISIGTLANAMEGLSTAIGWGSLANASSSMAIGFMSKALASYSIAIGSYAETSSSNAIAIGHNSEASNNSVAIGYFTKALGLSSIAIGNNNEYYVKSEGDYSISFRGTAIGEYSLAIAKNGYSDGAYSICMQGSSLDNGENYTDNKNRAGGICSFVIGSANRTGVYYGAYKDQFLSDGSFAMAYGYFTNAIGMASITGGLGSSYSAMVVASGIAAFAHQYVTEYAKDAAANYSAILAGINNTIDANATGAVIIAGNAITATQEYTTYTDAMRLTPKSTAPTNPEEGTIYFDSVLKKLRCWDGTIWNNLF
jgi:hypothetical protein